MILSLGGRSGHIKAAQPSQRDFFSQNTIHPLLLTFAQNVSQVQVRQSFPPWPILCLLRAQKQCRVCINHGNLLKADHLIPNDRWTPWQRDGHHERYAVIGEGQSWYRHWHDANDRCMNGERVDLLHSVSD